MLNDDILLNILGFFHHSDLPVLCRVDSFFHSYIVDKLYREITDPVNIEKLCRTINTSPHLATKIVSFTLTNGGIWSENRESLASLAEALGHMSNLRSLRLSLIGRFSWILEHTTFRLLSFHCAFQCESPLLRFLEAQAELEEIQLLQPLEHGAVLDPTSLPNLSIVDLPGTWLSLLIPSRPVYDVAIYTSNWDRGGGAIGALGLSTRPIEHLMVDVDTFRAIVAQIPSVLSTVEKLTLVTGGQYVEEPVALGDLNPMIVAAIPFSTSLKYLSITMLEPCIPVDDKDYEAFVNEISECSPRLEMMMFSDRSLETPSMVVWGNCGEPKKWIQLFNGIDTE